MEYKTEYDVIFDHSSYRQSMSLFSRAALKVAIVNIIAGLLFGYQIGFVAVYDTYTNINGNCTHLASEEACSSVKFAKCTWIGSAHIPKNESKLIQPCQHEDGVLCRLFPTEDTCSQHSECAYDHDSDLCQHVVGWSATELGIFAGAMIIGGMFGSFAIPPVLQRFGRKKSLLIIGIVAVIASILQSVAHAVNSYPLIVIARLLIGAACGASCVAAPMYVEEMAPEDVKNPLGVLFQVFCTLGIAGVAGLGLGLAPTNFSVDLQMEERFQIVLIASIVISVVVIPVAIFIPESKKWRPGGNANGEDLELRAEEAEESSSSKGTWGANVGQLTVAVFLSIAQQMTGINAIMNYAPRITKAAGLTPLLGNFVVMLWNFVTTLVSIPVAKKFSLRNMYLVGSLVASLACFITGIPVYPGVVSNDDAKHVLAGVGILIFIAAFEIGMGPAFYVLAQELFPRQFRGKGSSFTVVVQFVFNIIINVCFPIAVQGLSGGKSGDQDKGMGIVFMAFGTMGALSWMVLVKCLFPDDHKNGNDEDSGDSVNHTKARFVE